MTRVCYERCGDTYRLRSLHADGEGHCTLSLSPAVDGRLLIGDRTLTVRQGRANLPLASLPDGCYVPRLSTQQREQLLPALRKAGRVLLTAEGAEYVEALLCESAAQREALQQLSKRVSALEQAVNGTPLFDL